MSKLRVGVLRGGPSSEHEVSLKTGAAMLKHLPEDYTRHDLFVDKQGLWHIDGFQRRPEDIAHRLDVILNGLHGEWGEDGKVQRLLDTLKIPYTGSGSLASSIGMNKQLSKEHFAKAGIQTPHGIVVTEKDLDNIHALFQKIAPISVVKPNAAGSSVGVRITKSYADLEDAIHEALKIGADVLVEEKIDGREATVGVINGYRGEELYVLPSVKIVPAHNFFDYDSKYNGESEEICPGCFGEHDEMELADLARRAHDALGLRHYSRSDFIIDPRRGIFLLETNTLPGLTEESLLPKSLEAVGGTMSDFLDHIIKQALR